MSTNPYAAPGAQVEDVAIIDGEGAFVEEGRSVNAGRGLSWLAQAWGLFKEQPLVWLGQFLAMGVIMILLALLPYIGQILVSLAVPVLLGGIMLGAHQLAAGERLEFGKLFAGFSHRLGSLMLLGLFMLIASFAVFAVAAGIGGAGFAAMVGASNDAGAGYAALMTAVLIAMSLSVPIYMAMWFAPALVIINEFTVSQALVTSFKACLKNVLPFMIYGLLVFIMMTIASLPFGLGLILAVPVCVLAVYTSYRDVFYQD